MWGSTRRKEEKIEISGVSSAQDRILCDISHQVFSKGAASQLGSGEALQGPPTDPRLAATID